MFLDLLSVMSQTLASLTDSQYIMYMGLGILIGIIVGIIPGISGGVAAAIVLPFAFALPGAYATIMAVGALSVLAASDTISSVLLGVPGGVGSVATIVDGYSLARKGQAARALSAAFLSSIIGGIVGGLALLATIPLVTPIIKMFGASEVFMLCLLGLVSIGMLSGKRPIRGIIAALLGVFMAMVGPAPWGTYSQRFSFEIQYLWGGIPLVPALLGLFAIPELIDMIGESSTSAAYEKSKMGKGWVQGIKDVIDNYWLVARCIAIGIFFGFLPGLGASAASWMGYIHAAQSGGKNSQFGQGDVRGVIGPECATSACRGGDLIPTLFFGVPGSAAMAILMVILMVEGIQPGPDMLTKHLDVSVLIIYTVIIANVIGGLICFFLAKPLSYITSIPPTMLAAFTLMVCLAGAWQTTQDWGDFFSFLVIGAFGWIMKHTGFSRPACTIGFVLGGILERQFFITFTRYGFEFLLRPWVIVIGLCILATVYFGVRGTLKEQKATASIPVGTGIEEAQKREQAVEE